MYATKLFCRPKVVKQLRFDARKKVESGKVQEECPKKKSPSIPKKSPSIPKPETRKLRKIPPNHNKQEKSKVPKHE